MFAEPNKIIKLLTKISISLSMPISDFGWQEGKGGFEPLSFLAYVICEQPLRNSVKWLWLKGGVCTWRVVYLYFYLLGGKGLRGRGALYAAACRQWWQRTTSVWHKQTNKQTVITYNGLVMLPELFLLHCKWKKGYQYTCFVILVIAKRTVLFKKFILKSRW